MRVAGTALTQKGRCHAGTGGAGAGARAGVGESRAMMIMGAAGGMCVMRRTVVTDCPLCSSRTARGGTWRHVAARGPQPSMEEERLREATAAMLVRGEGEQNTSNARK